MGAPSGCMTWVNIDLWASECSPSGRTAAAWLLSSFKPSRALAGLCVNVGVLVVF